MIRRRLGYTVRAALAFASAAFAVQAASAQDNARTLSQGVDFLAQEAVAQLADVANGKFAVLPFVEETGDPNNPLRNSKKTAALGIYLGQQLADAFARSGKTTIPGPVLGHILRTNKFNVEQLGNSEVLRKLLGAELNSIVYGRMRRDKSMVTVGVNVIKAGADGSIVHLPQGRSITIGMSGNMFALCSMNGVLQPNPAVVSPGSPATPAAPMVIAAPMRPQVAPATPQPYNLEILVNDTPLPCFKSEDEAYYVPAVIGQDFKVRLTNYTDNKVAIALLVDGLSAIGKGRAAPVRSETFTAELPGVDTPADTYKYVLQPKTQLVVEGWQINEGILRKFVFTAPEKSVAGEMDFWDYMGSISAAFFVVRGEPAAPVAVQPAQSIEIAREGEKALPTVGTGQGVAQENKVTTVEVEYDRNPAAVLGFFYEQPQVIAAANMTPVAR